MKHFLAALSAWGTHALAVLTALGLPGLFLMAIVDGAGVPNPSGPDVILLLYTTHRPGDWWMAALCAVVGSMLGTVILFEVARRGGRKYLEEHLNTGRGKKFRDWFRHYGLVTVFIPALVPIPMPLKAFEICAGALGVSRTAFYVTFALARIPRYLALCWLGRGLHEEPLKFLKANSLNFVWIALATFSFCIILVKVADRHRKPIEN